MAEGLNKVLLIGNLGQDPELRHTQSGQAVLNLRMATGERFKDSNGDWKDKSEWHTVIVWGKRGEALAKILEKGKQIAVEGRLQTRSWEDKNGGKRSTTEIVATNVLLLGGRGEAGRSEGRHNDAPPAGSGAAGGGYGEDDIPFMRRDW